MFLSLFSDGNSTTKSSSSRDFRSELAYLADGVFRSAETLREIPGFFETFDPLSAYPVLRISDAQASFVPTLSPTSVFLAESFRQQHVIERSNYRQATRREGEFSCLPVSGAIVEAFENRCPSGIAMDTFVPNDAKRVILHLSDSTLNHLRCTVPNQTFRCRIQDGHLEDVTFGALDATSLFQDSRVDHIQMSISGGYLLHPYGFFV